MGICKFCGKNTIGASSCIESYIVINEVNYKPVPYAPKSIVMPYEEYVLTRCPECNVMGNGFHHLGCSLEICPKCGGYWLSCRCHGFKVKKPKIAKYGCTIIALPKKRVVQKK